MTSQEDWTDCEEDDETRGAAEQNGHNEVKFIRISFSPRRWLWVWQGGEERQQDPGLSCQDEEEEN